MQRRFNYLAGSALLAAAGLAHAITFDADYGIIDGWGQINSWYGTDDNGNTAQFLFGLDYGSPVRVSQQAYDAQYGSDLVYAHGTYALTNFAYARQYVDVQSGFDQDTFAQPDFIFTGLEMAAFSSVYGAGFSSPTATILLYHDTVQVGSLSVNLSEDHFTWFASPYSGPLDHVVIVSAGQGQRWLLDQIGLAVIPPAVLSPTAAIPEPETVWLMLLGGAGLLARFAARNRSNLARSAA